MPKLTDETTIDRSVFDCGCIFNAMTGQWLRECKEHSGRPKDCRCFGQDDGTMTCWMHHDCSDGSCTHSE